MTLSLHRITEQLAAVAAEGADEEAARILALAERDVEQAQTVLQRRLAGEPLGYILRSARFMGVDLEVSPGALVPRAESEILGRWAVNFLQQQRGSTRPRVLDMCCGAGNLACAIASHVPEAQVWASDLTDATVAQARRNVERLALTERVTVVQGDLFSPLSQVQEHFDLIVANPPYISSGRLQSTSQHLLDHEPREAFDAGPYGLAIHQRLIKEGVAFVRIDGKLAFEFGLGQERQIALLARRARAWSTPEFVNDGQGRPRVAVLQRQLAP